MKKLQDRVKNTKKLMIRGRRPDVAPGKEASKMADDYKKTMQEHAKRVCEDEKEKACCERIYRNGYEQGRLDTAFKLGAFNKLIAENIAKGK